MDERNEFHFDSQWQFLKKYIDLIKTKVQEVYRQSINFQKGLQDGRKQEEMHHTELAFNTLIKKFERIASSRSIKYYSK